MANEFETELEVVGIPFDVLKKEYDESDAFWREYPYASDVPFDVGVTVHHEGGEYYPERGGGPPEDCEPSYCENPEIVKVLLIGTDHDVLPLLNDKQVIALADKAFEDTFCNDRDEY